MFHSPFFGSCAPDKALLLLNIELRPLEGFIGARSKEQGAGRIFFFTFFSPYVYRWGWGFSL
jgi:hypothetical protein